LGEKRIDRAKSPPVGSSERPSADDGEAREAMIQTRGRRAARERFAQGVPLEELDAARYGIELEDAEARLRVHLAVLIAER
jgi:nitric oxide reductase activation protein